MKLIYLIPLTLLLLWGCSNVSPEMQVWNLVRCWDLVTYQFDVQVVYKDWDMIYWSWTMQESIYWNYSEKCNTSWLFDDCYKSKTITWSRTFDINRDECWRMWMDWEAIDRIRIERNRVKEREELDKRVLLTH